MPMNNIINVPKWSHFVHISLTTIEGQHVGYGWGPGPSCTIDMRK